MKLKLISLLLFVSAIIGCKQDAPDPKLAAEFIESYIQKTGNADYSNIGDYYSEEMKYGEDDAARIEKLKTIHDALGGVKNIELVETTSSSEMGQEATVTLKYRVKHMLMTVTETYTVKKEGQDYKILKQNIESVR